MLNFVDTRIYAGTVMTKFGSHVNTYRTNSQSVKWFWQHINSLWPSYSIWHPGNWSTLVQVMACCLTEPSHCLNKCWPFISKVQRKSSEGNFTRDTPAINHQNSLKNSLSKISFQSPSSQWVNNIEHLIFNMVYPHSSSCHLWCPGSH